MLFKGKGVSAPRVMCILAHGEPPTAKHETAHSCGNGHKGCMNPRHLSWKTAVENAADMETHGTRRKGTEINTNKLTQSDVTEIRSRPVRRGDLAELSDEFGVTKSTISDIRLRKTWAWLEYVG